MTPKEFEDAVLAQGHTVDSLVDGYAPFCKHVFVENFVDAACPVVPLNKETEPLVMSAYKARTEQVRDWIYTVNALTEGVACVCVFILICLERHSYLSWETFLFVLGDCALMSVLSVFLQFFLKLLTLHSAPAAYSISNAIISHHAVFLA